VGRDEVLSNDGDVALLLRSGDLVKLAFGSYNRADALGVTAVAPNLPEQTLPVAERPLVETPAPATPDQAGPNLLIWGLFSLAAVLLAGAAAFVIIMRQRDPKGF
jgi:hypothetical protein